ncbi:hypothetical protein PVJ1_00072 [Psychrobacillus phage PVJ1]|nr:hypothetical protein PVJ1_00072 [Psychrobacillus phage PVJ1]
MAKATAAVEFMYDKTATIKRYEEYEKSSGATGMDWVDKHVDVPCRLSSTTLNTASQDDANVIQYDVKMFLSSSYEVLAGDVIIVDEMKYESAKEPFRYVSHQEVLLIRKGYA